MSQQTATTSQLKAPKCARCLFQMILVGNPMHLYWRCGNCGAVKLS